MPHRELIQIARGKKTVETVEIHPKTQSNFVSIDEEGAITGVLPYELIAFHDSGSSVLVKLKGAKLYEITNGYGDLLYFEYQGERHQQINLDFFLGDVVRALNI